MKGRRLQSCGKPDGHGHTPVHVLSRYWIGDHAWVRAFVPNFYRVDEALYRSNHPGLRRLRKARNLGIRSILSLRGPRCMPSRLEHAACDQLGLELKFVRMSTVRLPSGETLLDLLEHFRTMPKPMLVHCKSGADRTGLAVTLYRHVIRGETIEEARAALHWSYGHLSFGKAGIVHGMLDAYAADHARTGIAFESWLRERYAPSALDARS